MTETQSVITGVKQRPYIKVWDILGGPDGKAPWIRVATDQDLIARGENPEEYEADFDRGWWARN